MGRKLLEQKSRIDPEQHYTPREALELLKSLEGAKFDESVEAHIHLNVDPRRADQMVRGTLMLPNGTGKTRRVAVFAEGEKAREAEEAGADVVGSEDLASRIKNDGFMDFDVAVATPDQMRSVGQLGPVLGPRGLMPNPKSGTVTQDVSRAVEEIKRGKTATASSTVLSARSPSTLKAWSRTTSPCARSCSGPAPPPSRAATSRPWRSAPRWGRR
jgi:large subunit ribosomal protein L1